VRYRLLGPLRVRDGTAWSPIRAAQQRVVLAVLLAEPGQVVSSDRLVAELWGDQPPREAQSALRGYVMRLRRTLGDPAAGRLVTRGHGYELEPRPTTRDRLDRECRPGQHDGGGGGGAGALGTVK